MQIHVFERALRALRRLLSRSTWSLRLLGLPRSAPSDEPGLVLIQIDGLSRPQLEHALKRGRMPFLRSLLKREGYHLHGLYSGLPSTTAAAQGELFYGCPGCVPAYGYRRRSDDRFMRMIQADCAAEVEAQLEEAGEPLLKSGSAYSNIYTGGAAEPHFCASRLTAAHMMRRVRPWSVLTVTILNFGAILRLAALLAVELGLAVYDAVRGSIARGEYRHEFLFLFSRVFACVGLREIMTAMACLDVTRGLPVVQLNYNGYDEQAHRRGPSSAFARFGLRGIDGSVRRVFRAAHRGAVREYEIWIHSDHGQEGVVPFLRLRGETLEKVAARLADGEFPAGTHGESRVVRSQTPVGGLLEERLLRRRAPEPEKTGRKSVAVAAMGPVAHVYWPPGASGLTAAAVAAPRFVEAGAPLALLALADGTARAFTPRGSFLLPRDAREVLGDGHPFPAACAADLAALCAHPDAGDIVLCGWNPDGPSVSFAFENGAHGGPGASETHAFALLPAHRHLDAHAGVSRMGDLRAAAQRLLRTPKSPGHRPPPRPEREDGLRVMTYNVHGLRGMDGRIAPDRIARVIAASRPDIIALQECYESGGRGQVEALRARLVERYHYPENLDFISDDYGNALISVEPLRDVWIHNFPAAPRNEQRGALGGSVERAGFRLRLCNTHFGLMPQERMLQARILRAWLFPAGTAHHAAPLILAGDFNAGPGSPSMTLLGRGLRDVQSFREEGPPRNTFFGRVPLRRIDHIFVTPSMAVPAIDVPRTHLTRLASDHLPLVADLLLAGK